VNRGACQVVTLSSPSWVSSGCGTTSGAAAVGAGADAFRAAFGCTLAGVEAVAPAEAEAPAPEEVDVGSPLGDDEADPSADWTGEEVETGVGSELLGVVEGVGVAEGVAEGVAAVVADAARGPSEAALSTSPSMTSSRTT